MCPYGVLNTLNVYSHMFQTAQARVSEAMDGAVRLSAKRKAGSVTPPCGQHFQNSGQIADKWDFYKK